MKYNDYPMPTEELLSVLSLEYKKQNKVGVLSEVSVLEQNAKLSELYVYISLQDQYLKHITKQNKNIDLKFRPEEHLKVLNEMGVNKSNVEKLTSLKTSFVDYLKCETEILKLLAFLIFLDNFNFNKPKLNKIFVEQIDIFYSVINV